VTEDRLELLESVVDALDDRIAVLEGRRFGCCLNPALLDLADADALVGRELEDVFADDLATTIRERARSPVIRWMDPISGVLETDASPPVDVFVAPLSDPDRTLCVVRDRHWLSRGRPVVDPTRARRAPPAETPSAVRDATTAAVRELAGADVAVWYRAEDDRFRPATVAAAERIGGDKRSLEPPPIDPDGSPLSDVLENEGAIAQADDDGAADHQETGGLTVYEQADLAGLLERAGLGPSEFSPSRSRTVPWSSRPVLNRWRSTDSSRTRSMRCRTPRPSPSSHSSVPTASGVPARARPPRSRRRADGTGVGRGAVDTGGRHARGGRATAL